MRKNELRLVPSPLKNCVPVQEAINLKLICKSVMHPYQWVSSSDHHLWFWLHGSSNGESFMQWSNRYLLIGLSYCYCWYLQLPLQIIWRISAQECIRLKIDWSHGADVATSARWCWFELPYCWRHYLCRCKDLCIQSWCSAFRNLQVGCCRLYIMFHNLTGPSQFHTTVHRESII